VKLPAQPPGVPWPTDAWLESPPDPDVDRERLSRAVDDLFSAGATPPVGETRAVVVIHRGRLVHERYAPGVDAETTLPSWSMAKSVLQAAVGILVREGRIDPLAPADVPAWRAPGDTRAAITLDHLLRMASGLAFREVYEAHAGSDVVEMLFGRGKDDVAGFAASFPLAHPPGTRYSYSSGDSNLVAGVVRRILGAGEPTLRFLQRELFHRIGMRSATPRFDAAGTFIGSSFVFATARDFARFGLLFLRGGRWDGDLLIPESWVDYARTPTPTPPCPGDYGAHWWLALDGTGTFSANGFQGQYTVCAPQRDVVVVRLGVSTDDHRLGLVSRLAEVVRSFPRVS
jgi:CubicO group peptidase (beta-lactamase class C family)